jgi:hypothetical protein
LKAIEWGNQVKRRFDRAPPAAALFFVAVDVGSHFGVKALRRCQIDH